MYYYTKSYHRHIGYTQYYAIDVTKGLTPWSTQHVFHVLCITSLDWNTLCYIPRSKRIPCCYTHSFIVSTFFYYLWCYPTCCSASVATAYMYLNAWLSVRYFSFNNIIVSARSATVLRLILVFTNRCALSKRLRNLVELLEYHKQIIGTFVLCLEITVLLFA